MLGIGGRSNSTNVSLNILRIALTPEQESSLIRLRQPVDILHQASRLPQGQHQHSCRQRVECSRVPNLMWFCETLNRVNDIP